MKVEITERSGVFRRLKSVFKRLLIKSRVHRLLKPFSKILMKVVYISKFVEWCSGNSNLQFNDINNGSVFYFKKRFELYKYLIKSEKLYKDIDFLEFGVYKGRSLIYWLENNEDPYSRFIGFDSFTGLPEDWGSKKQGTFTTTGQIPDIKDERCRFEVGLFQDTLGKFIAKFPFERRLVIHLDADLYSSTLYVLTRMAPNLKEGDIIIFDDFGCMLGFTNEFRSFIDFVSAYRLEYKVIGAVNGYGQVAIKVVKTPESV